jgi:hypothetical protein
MLKWLKELDRILRGDATRMDTLQKADLQIHVPGLAVVILCLAMIYGVCMGFYSLTRPDGPLYLQSFATLLKVPALFFLTLLVTFPSLYVFNALVGSRLNLLTILRLLIAFLAVTLAVLASLGTIVAFFSVSTESYPFMVLLNVLTFALSGFLGLSFLLQTLNRLDVARRHVPRPPAAPKAIEVEAENANESGKDDDFELVTSVQAEPNEDISALDRVGDATLAQKVRTVFTCWMIVFAIVGAQMSWVLRPFIGARSAPFQWFRPRGSNFFEAVFHTLLNLFS